MMPRARSTLISAFFFGVLGTLLLLTNVVVGNTYGRAGLGDYLFVLNLAQIGALLTGTTLGLIGLTSLPQEVEKSGPAAGASMVLSLSKICLIGSILVSSFVAPIALRSGGLFAMASVVMLFGIAFQNLTRDMLRGLNFLKSSYVVLMVGPLVMIIMAYFRGSYDQLPFTMSISYALSFFVSIGFIARLSTNRSSRYGELRGSYLASLVGPTIAIAASQSILGRTDVVILRIWAGSDAAGEMGAAITAAGLATMGLGAANAVYVPRLSRSGSVERRRLLTESQIIGGLAATLVLVAILIAGDRAFVIFGDGFEAARPLFNILALGTFASAVTGPVAYLGVAAGNASTVARVTVTAALANLVGDFLVFPLLGTIGLAIVTTAVAVGMNLFLLWLARTRWCCGGD